MSGQQPARTVRRHTVALVEGAPRFGILHRSACLCGWDSDGYLRLADARGAGRRHVVAHTDWRVRYAQAIAAGSFDAVLGLD